MQLKNNQGAPRGRKKYWVTSAMCKGLRDGGDGIIRTTEPSLRMENHIFSLTQNGSIRLRSLLAKEMRRYAKLKEDTAEMAEENNSNKAGLATFEKDSAQIQSRQARMNMIARSWLSQLQKASNEVGVLSRSLSLKSGEEPGTKCQRAKFGETVLEIQSTLGKLEDISNAVNLKPENHRCPVCYDVDEDKNDRPLSQGNEIEKLEWEVKHRLKNRTIVLSKDLRDMNTRATESSSQIENLRHDLRMAMQESVRLRSTLMDETRRCAQLKQDKADLAEENNSNKARLAKFEEDSANSQSRNAQIKTIASRCLSQLQMASNEVGVLSRSIHSRGVAEPDAKRQRTEFGETVLEIQSTLGKLEGIADVVNLKPENHRCPVCYDSYGGKVIPALLQCCLNHVCVDCVEKDRAQKISLLVGNKKRIQCMLCNHPFHCAKDSLWKVNLPYIEAIGIRVDLNDLHQVISSPQVNYHVGTAGRRHDFMIATLQVDDWLIFKGSDNEHQRFWLGKAVAKPKWDGSCKTRNETNAAVSIEGALIDPGCYAINVQWYTQRAIGVLEYVKEGQPLVQSNEDLRLSGINRHVNHRRDDEGSYFELDDEIRDRAESLIVLRHL